jgi:hypothetical protein
MSNESNQRLEPKTLKAPPSSTSQNVRLFNRFSNLPYNFIGTLLGTSLGIVGILLSIYFYLQSREYRELTYYVHPVKASVLKAGEGSKLQCNFQGQSLTSNVTATQIAIWNQGERPIKRENILKPVILYRTDGAPILEAIVRKQSRDVVNLALDTSELTRGRLPLSWAILEQNDGAIIQLTYAGGPDVPIAMSGVVEGQANIQQVAFQSKIQSPEEQYKARVSGNRSFRWIMIGLGIVYILSALLVAKIQRRRDTLRRILLLITALTGLALLCYNSVLMFLSKPLGPPFGFD